MDLNEYKYNNIIKQADEYFKINKLELANENYQKSLKIKPNNEYPKLQMFRIKSIKILEEKFIKITQKVIGLEFVFKAYSKNNTEFSKKELKRLKKAYGETFINFSKTKTEDNLSKLFFPKDSIKINYIFYQNNQEKIQAVIWDKNKVFIYKSLHEIILHVQETIRNETNTKVNIKNSDLLLGFLNKYSLILSKENICFPHLVGQLF